MLQHRSPPASARYAALIQASSHSEIRPREIRQSSLSRSPANGSHARQRHSKRCSAATGFHSSSQSTLPPSPARRRERQSALAPAESFDSDREKTTKRMPPE